MWQTKGLILCSKKEILWVESRDLSQTDNSYYGVFFSKVEWWVVELLILSLNNWGLNFLKKNPLNSLRFTFHQKNWARCLLFNLANDCLLNWANSQKWQLFSLKLLFWVKTGVILWICLALQVLSYIFLSLRKITWLNSQKFHLRTQNEELSKFENIY